MSAPQTALNIQQRQPNVPQSQEPNKNQPSQPDDQAQQMLAKYGEKLLLLDRKMREQWSYKRRGIILKVLKNKEMLKGNHNIGFYPGTYETFDAFAEYQNFTGDTDPQKQGDRSMDQRPHNFYQMLEKAFVSAMSSSVPKTRSEPENADVEEDRETAKIASRVQTIIETANKIRSMIKHELMELFTSGCYFKHTRYVVDSDRTGTHKETVLQVSKTEILPARYICFACGMMTPADQVQDTSALCPNCGTPFSPENFFQDHVESIPVAEQKDDVPNGMVLQGVYGPMHVDADPDVDSLLDTPLLNLSFEVSLGWLRTTFPDYWDKLTPGNSSGSANELQERQYRDMLTTAAGYSAWSSFSSQVKPTYSRTWFQPTSFAEGDFTRPECEELQKAFPKGCMLAFTGDIPLQIRAAKLTDEWTWCGSEQKGFGLFPAPLGDPGVPVQERINDCINKIDEYMDRLACGILLANSRYVDSKSMNNKSILPGMINPIAFKANAPFGAIQDAIYQVKAEIDAQIFTYLSMLKQDMELLVSTPPQTFGAGTQQGVETMGGQQQQLQTGMMKMGLVWDNLRDEHAEGAQNAIECAAKNMTEDWLMVVSDETKEFRNEYVHLDQLKGSIHVVPDTDQAFPMTVEDQRAFWQDVVQNGQSMLSQWLMSVPKNVDSALRVLAPQGVVAPQAAIQSFMLGQIERLIQGKPVDAQDPVTGDPIQVPSLQPDKYLMGAGGLKAAQAVIEQWSVEHWDKLESNQDARNNLVAYYKMLCLYSKELEAETQLAPPSPPPQGPHAPPPAAA